ncbi:MAG TPA: hypothetical protein VFL38_16220 [Humibacillus xanthopallidus]|nr:hypothetical protein [Humibacillus xanthopallidus]HET9633172.1 hypothetical protein [Terrabacter sp.]
MASLDRSRPFTLAEARAAGLTRWQVEGRRFQRVVTGVYVAADVELTTPLRAAAALLVCPGGAVVSHHTAAALWGAVVPHSPDVHVSVPGQRRVDVRGVRAHRPTVVPPTSVRRGLPVTSPERTFLDLASVLDLVDLVVLGDSLVHARVTSPAALRTAASRHRGRGARLARRAAELVRVGAESAMETRVRLLVVLAGLPEPVLQHPVSTRFGSYRLDLAWPAVGVALEYDGRHHIQREHQWAADLGRREQLEGDGWRLLVVIAGDVFTTPETTVHRVETVLRAAGLPVRAGSGEWRRHFPGRAAA